MSIKLDLQWKNRWVALVNISVVPFFIWNSSKFAFELNLCHETVEIFFPLWSNIFKWCYQDSYLIIIQIVSYAVTTFLILISITVYTSRVVNLHSDSFAPFLIWSTDPKIFFPIPSFIGEVIFASLILESMFDPFFLLFLKFSERLFLSHWS